MVRVRIVMAGDIHVVTLPRNMGCVRENYNLSGRDLSFASSIKIDSKIVFV